MRQEWMKRTGQIVDAATAVGVPPSVVVPRLRQVMRLCHWRQGPREGTAVPQICALSTQQQHIGVNLCMRRQRTLWRLRCLAMRRDLLNEGEHIEHERQIFRDIWKESYRTWMEQSVVPKH